MTDSIHSEMQTVGIIYISFIARIVRISSQHNSDPLVPPPADAERRALRVGLVVRLVRHDLALVQAPLGHERLLLSPRRRELEVASLLGDDGALVGGLQAGDQAGLEPKGRKGKGKDFVRRRNNVTGNPGRGFLR